ncbi:hypothetical protein [Nocardia terpenica]|uniref:hypothetical protein n=1 Tax=Nocardia terpenica TaxID=455432 RepID=UPI001E540715|nr:hypothetical protein [Nocardia terpenica]
MVALGQGDAAVRAELFRDSRQRAGFVVEVGCAADPAWYGVEARFARGQYTQLAIDDADAAVGGEFGDDRNGDAVFPNGGEKLDQLGIGFEGVVESSADVIVYDQGAGIQRRRLDQELFDSVGGFGNWCGFGDIYRHGCLP